MHERYRSWHFLLFQMGFLIDFFLNLKIQINVHLGKFNITGPILLGSTSPHTYCNIIRFGPNPYGFSKKTHTIKRSIYLICRFPIFSANLGLCWRTQHHRYIAKNKQNIQFFCSLFGYNFKITNFIDKFFWKTNSTHTQKIQVSKLKKKSKISLNSKKTEHSRLH